MDLIISKMFRGTEVDIEDCLMLLRKEPISKKELVQRYHETASYDVSEERLKGNLNLFLARAEKEKLL